jgi:hypothetical protein
MQSADFVQPCYPRIAGTLAAWNSLKTAPSRPDRHHVAGDRLRRVEQRGAGNRVCVITDVPAVMALSHLHARIMGHGDDPKRHVGPDLANDIAVTQRVDRYLGRITKPFPVRQAATFDDTLERSVMVCLLPGAAAPVAADRFREQCAVGGRLWTNA